MAERVPVENQAEDTASTGSPGLFIPVDSVISTWFLEQLVLTKLSTRDFFIYLLLLCARLNRLPIPRNHSKPDDALPDIKDLSIQALMPEVSKLAKKDTPTDEDSLEKDCEVTVEQEGDSSNLKTRSKRKAKNERKTRTPQKRSTKKAVKIEVEDDEPKKRGRPLTTSFPLLVEDPNEDQSTVSHEDKESGSPRVFPKGREYILHKDVTARSISQRYVYECKLCGKRCRGWASWFHHRNTHLNSRPENVCPTCGWKTTTKAGMWAHRRKHKNSKEKCPHCEYEHGFKSSVKLHVKEVHPEYFVVVSRQHLCDICGKEFKTASNLTAHVKLHEEKVRNQVCHMCGKDFYSVKLLKDHIRAVHDDKRYSCDKCPLKFAKRRSLNVHVNRVHLRIKDIACTYENCDQMFYEMKDLKQHVLVHHTKEKNYQCEWEGCTKTFRNQYHRKIHMRIHTGEKPLQCPHCDYTARQRSSLNCHLKKHAMDMTDTAGPTPVLLIPAATKTYKVVSSNNLGHVSGDCVNEIVGDVAQPVQKRTPATPNSQLDIPPVHIPQSQVRADALFTLSEAATMTSSVQHGQNMMYSVLQTSLPVVNPQPEVPHTLPVGTSQPAVSNTQHPVPSVQPLGSMPLSQPTVPFTKPPTSYPQPTALSRSIQAIVQNVQPFVPQTQQFVPHNQPTVMAVPHSQPLAPNTQSVFPMTQVGAQHVHQMGVDSNPVVPSSTISLSALQELNPSYPNATLPGYIHHTHSNTQNVNDTNDQT